MTSPSSPRRGRIVSGMRPTGKLHIGHLVGALENWVALQRAYENFHLIADYHVLTTSLDTSGIAADTEDMVLDWIAAGIDPAESPIFRQSRIKQHTELHLIFSMLVTSARLERNPTLKDQVRDLELESVTYGHLGYPVLQSADILLYKGEVVPVGEDQRANVEITREIARRFNATWGEVFPEPEAKLTKFARLPGLDRRKMSKSLGNTILLGDPPATIATKLRGAITDERKVRKNDPGRPEVCLVYSYHEKFNAGETGQIAADCRAGTLGCVDCKKIVGTRIADALAPIRDRREAMRAGATSVAEILDDGESRARAVAERTMAEVRAAMRIG